MVAVHRQAMTIDLDLPIVRAVHATLYEGVPPIEALADLMRLPIGSELASLRYR
jgi:glycerol-3-phosphate dehydrogenase